MDLEINIKVYRKMDNVWLLRSKVQTKVGADYPNAN